MKLDWDIRARVLAAALIPTLLLGILLTTTMTVSRLGELDEALLQRGQALARQLGASVEFGLFSGNQEALQHLVASTLIQPDVKGAAVFDRDGALVAAAGWTTGKVPQPTGRAGVLKLDPLTLYFGVPVGLEHGQKEDPYTETRVEDRGRGQLGRVALLLSREALESRKTEQIRIAVITLASVLLGSVLLSFLLARSVSRPLHQIARAVTEIGWGNLSVRVPVTGGATLQRLARGVNDMAQRLTLARDNLQQQIEAATVQLRERTEEAERANLAKSRFLAAASHDLRQPMHALGLFIGELAHKTHFAQDRELIGRIASAAEAMENLLDSLLDISRLDAGVVVATPRPLALGPLLQRLEKEYQHLASDKGLHLRVVPTDLWVISDAVLLERILNNLVSNALRYTPTGSVLIAVRRRRHEVLIEVRDSGVGIPQDQHCRVFQEFVQLNNTARDRSKGIGLGLAIVRRLVDLLGHSIDLSSSPGKGSVFRVRLPRCEPARIPESPRTHELDFTGRVVAIVDDDQLAQDSLAGLLRAWGCFAVASDGLESLMARLDDLDVQPEVVMSDYRLPGAHDGIDVIDTLRQRYGEGLPALLLTGDTGAEILRRAADQGIPLLSKPVRPAQLRAALAHWFADLGA